MKKREANERLNRKWIASKRINVFNEALECCCCYCCCSHWKASPKMEYFYREISFLYFSISEWMEMNMKINCRYARHRKRTSIMKMMKMMMMQTTWILNILWCFCIDHFQFTTVEWKKAILRKTSNQFLHFNNIYMSATNGISWISNTSASMIFHPFNSIQFVNVIVYIAFFVLHFVDKREKYFDSIFLSINHFLSRMF